jgi:hypothetical protein
MSSRTTKASATLGWPSPTPNCCCGRTAIFTASVRINGDAELLLTLDVGPRILSYRLRDGKNIFKEYPEQLGKTGEGAWMIRGGHRLSVAPENSKRSYAADNGPVAYKVLDKSLGSVRLSSEPDTVHGLRIEMDVQLAAKGSRVKVVHRIKNNVEDPGQMNGG